MSFRVTESGECVRQHFNPEDVSDGKPRVLKFRMINTREKSSKEKDPEKHLMLNILGDLSSETLVLLGKTRMDQTRVEEELKKNLEWENWKKERNITEWKPKRTLPILPSPHVSPIQKKRSVFKPSKSSKSSKVNKSKGQGILPSSPRKGKSTIIS